jgi:DNA-binding response OmpR family regulator
VAALLRRGPRTPAPTEALRIGDVEVDRESRRVRRHGSEVHLTPTEFDLLVRLASRPGAVLSREQLLADVWSWSGAGGTTRTVDSHVAALRRKLGDAIVRTVHGVGYAVGDATS